MSKLNRFQKIVIGAIIFVLIIGIVLRIMSGSFVGNLGYDTISMLKYSLIDAPVKTVSGWMDDLATLWKVQEENDILQYRLSKNPSYKAKYEEEKRKNTELEEALKLKEDNTKYVDIWAKVISRDSTRWNNEITINVGEKDGIKDGMAVESVKGMIGKVESVSKYTSIVKLLTCEDKSSAASIKVNIDDKKSIHGALQGYDVKKGMYVVYLYEDSDKVKKDMQVITSGMGKGYPSGLLIGTIDSMQSLSNQSGQITYVKPIDDFKEFSIVRVIKEKLGDNQK